MDWLEGTNWGAFWYLYGACCFGEFARRACVAAQQDDDFRGPRGPWFAAVIFLLGGALWPVLMPIFASMAGAEEKQEKKGPWG